MVVVWADASVHSTGKTKSSATNAALSSPLWLHMAIKTERTDTAMAQTFPSPQTPVSIFQVHAPRSRVAPISIPAGFPLLAGKQPEIYSAKALVR
jgi:hypothetical protein